MKTMAVSLDNKDSNKQSATTTKLLFDLRRKSSQIAVIPNKKNNSSCIDGIANTTCEFMGCTKKTKDKNKANTGLKKYLKTKKPIIAHNIYSES
jgi:hypothetical protein